MRFKKVSGNAKFDLNTDRFDKQFMNAHKKLNMAIVSDSTPYIPFRQGDLRSKVRYPDGIYGNVIEWYAPYAHYQYMGELYLAGNGSSFASKGEKKYPSGLALHYYEPNTGSMWYEKAKKEHMYEWVRIVRRAGGGN